MNIKKLIGIAGVCMGLSGQAMAAYVPGTLITPNAAFPQNQFLVLENSLVDLVHNIEILNFSFTQNKSLCDVYKGLTSNYLSNKTICMNAATVYTAPVLNQVDGWRIGTSRNMLDVVEMFPRWWRPASWLTIFNANRTAMDVISETLGSTRIVEGKSSFNLYTSDGIESVNSYKITLDEINYTGGDTGYRTSQGGGYADFDNNSSVLMVRDWLGQERPINSANAVTAPGWWLTMLGFAGLFFRRRVGKVCDLDHAGGV